MRYFRAPGRKPGTIGTTASQALIEGETWRPAAVPKYGSVYDVSDFGRVRRSTATKHGPAGRIKKLCWWGRKPQYLHVLLSENNEPRFFRVATLVALTWLGPRPTPEHEVNHKNADHGDNRVENLEWVTNPENQSHSQRMGLRKHSPDARPKLTVAQVKLIRVASGSQRAIGERFGVTDKTVRLIKTRRTWRDVA